MKRHDSGFSMIEVLVVMGLLIIGASVALIQMNATRTILDADANSNMVVAQMRYAREVAIDQRRNVLVEFEDPDRILVTRLDPSGNTVISDIRLSGGYRYGLPGGTLPDTPEAFGISDAISFNGAIGGTFLGDGTFVDPSGVVLNGTVYTIGAPGSGSLRAVTLTGATGRIKQYWLDNGVWEETTR